MFGAKRQKNKKNGKSNSGNKYQIVDGLLLSPSALAGFALSFMNSQDANSRSLEAVHFMFAIDPKFSR
jgi:hypothetical protein